MVHSCPCCKGETNCLPRASMLLCLSSECQATRDRPGLQHKEQRTEAQNSTRGSMTPRSLVNASTSHEPVTATGLRIAYAWIARGSLRFTRQTVHSAYNGFRRGDARRGNKAAFVIAEDDGGPHGAPQLGCFHTPTMAVGTIRHGTKESKHQCLLRNCSAFQHFLRRRVSFCKGVGILL